RSPKDRYVVKEPSCEDKVDWGDVNVPIEPEKFDRIFNKVKAFYQDKDLYIQDVFVGADENYKMPIQIISHMAWAGVFSNTLFIQSENEEKLNNHQPEFTVIHAPKLRLDPEMDGVRSEVAVIVNFGKKIVLVVGSAYAGEIKKSIFAVMNYFLPQKGVLSMHCSANVGSDNDSALFFGLSGTGKTSLSADPERKLIGDDEHGWTDNGVFNFEGGCYAKVIRLSQEKEPQIYNAIKFGSIAENVVLDDETRVIDFDDAAKTENTRATYPVEYIDNALIPGVGDHPKNIMFLTADAFGVLPPISKLTPQQAMYHFMSGYTSKLAGTEAGVTEPEATFSACFGAPFLPLPAAFYAKMLG
ncbi:MAG: phosphoenolpyruvate carboxykinase (ATP), partial [Calditrichia bacterium]|nr:phosphoenolpyruvate carboxykinase (ATP) [Calditrichia bacterium]